MTVPVNIYSALKMNHQWLMKGRKIENKMERIHKFSCGCESLNCYCWNIFNDLSRGECYFLFFFIKTKNLSSYACNYIHNMWHFYALVHYAAAAAAAKSLQSCPTLCDPIHGSPPGSPVPGILQARTLEWDAISFSNAWKWK